MGNDSFRSKGVRSQWGGPHREDQGRARLRWKVPSAFGSFRLLRGVAAAVAAVGMWATRTRRPSSPPQARASCPRRLRPGRPSSRPATPPSVSCRPAPGEAGFRCTTARQNTHRTGRAGIGGYEAVVAYRWHAWFGRTVHVHELIDRNAGVVARCRLDDRASGAIQEVPLWMLDAATCATMHDVGHPAGVGIRAGGAERPAVGGDGAQPLGG
jgi:hypothetical protein